MGNGLAVSKELWEVKQRQLGEWRKANLSDDGSLWYQFILSKVLFGHEAKVLDVGAMDGRIRKCFPTLINYVGIDPKPEGPVIKGMAEALPFKDGTFDFVTCFASLFHFINLEQSFKEMRRVLKEGGQLLVLVILKGPCDMDSRSHTFRLTHEIMDDLAKGVELKLINKERVEALNSWFYRWVK
jgi:SAM-dependent methyltransferase